MLRSAQLRYIKHNIQTFHIYDISNNNENITLWSIKNNTQDTRYKIQDTKLYLNSVW